MPGLKPFTFMHEQEPWPEGLTLLHVYVVADLARNPEPATLVQGCRAATAGWPLAHVGDDKLHITLYQLGTPADQVTEPERTAAADALRSRLKDVSPFTVTAGSALSYESGVVFYVGPDAPLNPLRERVAAVMGADLPAYAASLRGKASALGLQLADEVSCDIVHSLRRLPRPQRRALARDGALISRQDRRRWIIVRVWAAVLASRQPG
jgi:hypothetical protein